MASIMRSCRDPVTWTAVTRSRYPGAAMVNCRRSAGTAGNKNSPAGPLVTVLVVGPAPNNVIVAPATGARVWLLTTTPAMTCGPLTG